MHSLRRPGPALRPDCINANAQGFAPAGCISLTQAVGSSGQRRELELAAADAMHHDAAARAILNSDWSRERVQHRAPSATLRVHHHAAHHPCHVYFCGNEERPHCAQCAERRGLSEWPTREESQEPLLHRQSI
eukprot:COSAG06_NODE_1142_length_10545_cov_2.879571_6_plen_133_part_00